MEGVHTRDLSEGMRDRENPSSFVFFFSQDHFLGKQVEHFAQVNLASSIFSKALVINLPQANLSGGLSGFLQCIVPSLTCRKYCVPGSSLGCATSASTEIPGTTESKLSSSTTDSELELSDEESTSDYSESACGSNLLYSFFELSKIGWKVLEPFA